MKKINFIILFFKCYFLFSQEILESPQNPAFLDYLHTDKKSLFTEDGYPLSYVPPPVKYHFQSSAKKNINGFPTRYDLRDSLFVTTVKNQGNCGCCWAFSVLGSIESNWLLNRYGSSDFSEEHMKNCHGFEVGGCTSGNAEIADAYLTRGSGPVLETEIPYVPQLNSCVGNMTPATFVNSSMYFPNDPAVVKQALLDYGGLFISMYMQTASYNAANKSYYYHGNTSVNHAVVLIGWDDTKITAGGTGAWIAKNSWGTSWGEQGCFYISYNDSKALTSVTCFPKNMQTDNEMTLYMYDNLGRTSDLGYGNSVAFGLVRFNVVSAQKLTKIGLVVNTENTIVDVEIFTNKREDKLINRVGSVLNYKCNFPGYITFDLPVAIHFNAGEEMYIKVKYNSPGNNYPLPFERYIANYANPDIEKNVCWVSSNGDNWESFGNDIPWKERDLCIRAYMFPDTISGEKITDVKVYPNPAAGIVNVEFLYSEADEISVDVFNVYGALLSQFEFVKTNNQVVKRLDFTKFAKGVYLFRIKSATYTKEIKMIFL